LICLAYHLILFQCDKFYAVYSDKELKKNFNKNVKDVYYEWLRWRFGKVRSFGFLESLKRLVQDVLGEFPKFFNVLEIIEPLISNALSTKWDMFQEKVEKSQEEKILLSDEAFTIQKEEYVDTKYLIKGSEYKLSDKEVRRRNKLRKKAKRKKYREKKRMGKQELMLKEGI
jgi:hypothetical protein